MYQLINVSPKELSKVKITNQQKIRELTGSELDLQKAFEVIKAESNGFIEDNEKAKEADRLFFELLKQNHVDLQENTANNQTSSDDKNVRLRLRERERMRMISLLELELQLPNQSE